MIHSIGKKHLDKISSMYQINVIKSDNFIHHLDDTYKGKADITVNLIISIHYINIKVRYINTKRHVTLSLPQNKSYLSWTILINESTLFLYNELKETISYCLNVIFNTKECTV